MEQAVLLNFCKCFSDNIIGETNMFSNGVSLNASSYKNLFTSGSGTLYVPVSPSAVVYTQFSHVRGMASTSSEGGVSVNKIKILNTLIDQLVSMKTKQTLSKNQVAELSDNQKDVLIKQYQKQIQTEIEQSVKSGTFSFAGLMPEPGAVVNFKA